MFVHVGRFEGENVEERAKKTFELAKQVKNDMEMDITKREALKRATSRNCRRPNRGSKRAKILNMQRDTIVKIF